ncbi:MAG: 1,4-alpha-glucan branching protein GlgB [Eubacteriales bacterium]
MNYDEFIYLYKKGAQLNAHDVLGAHLHKNGVIFRVFAPNAKSVSVVGDFNSWNRESHYMERKGDIFELYVENIGEGHIYKYAVKDGYDNVVLKADPYAFYTELRPNNASVVADPFSYEFTDNEWMKKRKKTDFYSMPMNIYEVSLTSFTQSCTDYSSIDLHLVGKDIVRHVKNMGYTHVEIMPITEYPLDMSWGYQVTGYFAPTSRLGGASALQEFINLCHENEIGVIMDWVPGHFCPDEHGLFKFDSTDLYGFKKHLHWGTYKFDFGKHHVWSFLLSSALYFAKYFHVDGIRVDGVTSMIQYNFGDYDHPIEYDSYAIKFLQEFNSTMHKYFQGFLTIAEESSDYLGITAPVENGGLGFDYKWDMGWMNDTLKYFEYDFNERVHKHNILTFSSTYRQREKYILPFSHDEVVHGKKQLVEKLPGDYWQRFAGLRTLLAYQMFTQGKKLNFMGTEIAQMMEWRYYEPIEFFMLKYPMHNGFNQYVKSLNEFYRENSELYELDFDYLGFEWIDADNSTQGVISFVRRNKSGDELIIILNLSFQHFDEFVQGVPQGGMYREVFTSNKEEHGGSGHINPGDIPAAEKPWQKKDFSVTLQIGAFSTTVLKKIN